MPTSFTRRQALVTLAAGTAVARHAFADAKPLFRYSMLDHLAIAVDDNEKSIRFYSRVFGNEVLKEKNGPRHYIKLGPRNYIATAPPAAGEKSQIVHHICPGIVGFDGLEAQYNAQLAGQAGVARRTCHLGLLRQPGDLLGSRQHPVE